MTNKISKVIMVAVLMNFIIILTTSPVYAHKIIIEPVESGIIKVMYEDGRFSTRTEVVVYDKDSQILVSGKLDEKGYFYYANEPDAALIIADDGLGHKAEWVVGVEENKSGMKKNIAVVMVLLVLGTIALLFNQRASAKK